MTEPVSASTGGAAPDRPPLPRAKRSWFTYVVLVWAVVVVGGYTAVAVTQRELSAADKDEIPGSVRSSPGGYRSYSFWHSGYHGGK